MRIALIPAAMFMATACGQTGSLYLPDDAVETPVEIRAPAEPADDEEKKKDTQPPGG
jgi:predicted small lipoprotein YifL